MANPVLSDKQITKLTTGVDTGLQTNIVSRSGTARWLLGFTAVLIVAATEGWHLVQTNSSKGNLYFTGALIAALLVALFIAFVPKSARFAGWIYAGLEGVVLGAVSALYNQRFHGIVVQAIGATLAVVVVTAALYASGVVHVTDKFRRTVYAATSGVFFFYLAAYAAHFFFHTNVLTSGGPLAIGVSVVTSTIAAFNLFTDYDQVDQLIEDRADASLNAYGAFGLLITIVWLFLELLRLLGNTSSSSRR